MALSALLIDPATETISPLEIPTAPNVKAALASIIGRQPKFAWISSPSSAIAYSDEAGGAPTFFEINGSPKLCRKAVIVDFAGGAFCDTSMTAAELKVLIRWGGEPATERPAKSGRQPAGGARRNRQKA